jgi:hypothetical protein
MEFLQMMNLMNVSNETELLKCGLAFVIGLAVHIMRQMFVERVSLREYLTEHKGRTYLSMGSLVSTFALLQTSYPEAPLLVYMMGGYCIDSLMNKAPLSMKKLSEEIG